jgi:cytoskeletal protein CcmA (bactofilin family)
MFGKQAKSPATGEKPAEAPRKTAPASASLVGPDVTIEGDFAGQGLVHVEGAIKGGVRVGELILGDSGHIEGAVFADVVEIRGKVKGAIQARTVRLHATAQVTGDIVHETLSMEPGAYFEGRSVRTPAATVIEAGAPVAAIAAE